MLSDPHVTDPCPFCSIPAERVVWSDAHVLAIRDGFPVSPGHTLILPRRHVETWFDASGEEHLAIVQAIAEVKRSLDAGEPPPDGYNVGFNAGSAAGQTVMHLHVHVIPRYRGDMDDPRGGVRGVIPSKQKYGSADADPFGGIAAFTHGQEGPLLPALTQAIQGAAEIDIVAAFVQLSGLDVIEGDLTDALDRGARVRLLTGDYLGITHPHALQRLYALTTRMPELEVRLYRTAPGEVFHPKAYIFAARGHGLAFVGSSNLSRSALTAGIEWNLRTTRADAGTFRSIRARFVRLFTSPQASPLTPELLGEYQRRVRVPPAPEPAAALPLPHAIQREVLAALAETRALEETRGVVVMATGLGKTLLAAFDFAATGGRRALFVAHRDEILTQAAASWARALPDRSIGFLTGDQKEPDADLVFASVATLARRRHLHGFAPDHFDYVVVDEFHHAAAASYRKLLEHFRPRFLLGLTATPDRMDGARLLDLCDGNEVARVGIYEGITRGFLSPFRYHGIADELDYTGIPWRSGRFDADVLTTKQATRERAAQALREYLRHAPAPRRSLIFCCSRAHADFTAAYFREHGVAAVSVHSGPTSASRAESVRRLRDGEVEAIVTVDLFNEGFDVPDVDTILMLRPTESPIVFLQQLGRGLRKGSAAKPALRVVDFIGNHRGFLVKPRALLALAGLDASATEAVWRLRQGGLELPAGCSVDVETRALDLLDEVVRVTPADALIHAYERLRDGHGRRPGARELLEENGTLKPVEQRHLTWFDFVGAMGDLTDEERVVLDAHRSWFADLAGTQMARSYKMVALEVLDAVDALHDGMSVRELSLRCRERMRRDPRLRPELEEHERAGGTLDDFVRRWREMPLRIFHDAKGFSRQWFELQGDTFASLLEVRPADRETFDRMTAELVEYRLADYLARARREENVLPFGGIELTVSHGSGKPILRFDRSRSPSVPEGDALVEVDGDELLFRFKRIAVNVVTERRGGPNVLTDRMRRWFGPKAGLPGTRHRAELRRKPGGGWQLVPQRATGTSVARLPFYELKVACGSPATQFEEAPSHPVDVCVDRPVDPRRHFVLRASGDSMDGGRMPIRDGDLVLCEWVAASNAKEFEGVPVLVSSSAADEVISAIKLLIELDGVWLLRSTNPAHADLRIDPGVEIRIAARVLGSVEVAEGQ